MSLNTQLARELQLINEAFPLVDKLGLGGFVTPKEAKHIPIYNWFVYPHSYSPSLIWYLIDYFKLGAKHRILDPFAGAGTTILAAKERGISASGIDLLPISAGLIQGKIANYSFKRLKRTINRITKKLGSLPNMSGSEIHNEIEEMLKAPNSIIARAFTRQTLDSIVQIKTVIQDEATNRDDYHFALIALLNILETHSLTLKAGGWLKMLETPRSNEDIKHSFLRRLYQMYDEVKLSQPQSLEGNWDVQIGDARHFHSELGKFDAIITSPPYLNRHDYTRVLCLELLIGFLSDYGEIISLRHNLLRSHVEAKTILEAEDYVRPAVLDELLKELNDRKAESRVLYIVEGYFEDLFLTLQTCYRYLNDGGYSAFVVGNVRFSGLIIPVDQILAQIGQLAGLKFQSILVARRRNNSAQQMRDYGRDPSRESVVIWQKNPKP